jgi:hypothetical protein
MTDDNSIERERRAGHGIDPEGGRVIDPTKNVLDLVKAESKYQDGMRDQLKEMHKFAIDSSTVFQNYARDTESRMQSWMRDSETKRVDQLTTQRADYEKRIADMLAESVKSTQALVSTQLLQIQGAFGERLNKLEEFRLVSQGRSSVADPALATSLAALSSGIGDIQSAFAKALAESTKASSAAIAEMAASITALKESRDMTAGRFRGIGESWGILVGAAGVIIAIAALFYHAGAHP